MVPIELRAVERTSMHRSGKSMEEHLVTEDTHHHQEEGQDDEATMHLLEELSMAGFHLYNNLTTIRQPVDDDRISAWVLALVGEGAATVDSSPSTEDEDEEPAVSRAEEA